MPVLKLIHNSVLKILYLLCVWMCVCVCVCVLLLFNLCVLYAHVWCDILYNKLYYVLTYYTFYLHEHFELHEIICIADWLHAAYIAMFWQKRHKLSNVSLTRFLLFPIVYNVISQGDVLKNSK